MAKSRLIQQANSDVARSLQEAMSHVPAHQRRQVAAKFQALFEMYTEGHNWRVPKQVKANYRLWLIERQQYE